MPLASGRLGESRTLAGLPVSNAHDQQIVTQHGISHTPICCGRKRTHVALRGIPDPVAYRKLKRGSRTSWQVTFATERPQLEPLPLWVPELYLLHHRIVDSEGYVTVNTHRYSVPPRLIGRRMEVRETAQRIEIYEGPRRIAEHQRPIDSAGQRHTLPEHRPARGEGPRRRDPSPEEKLLLESAPEIRDYVAALKRRGPGRGTLTLRRLLQMVREYPRRPLLQAVHTAAQYGLYDLERVERMVLREIAGEYFVLRDDERDEEPER